MLFQFQDVSECGDFEGEMGSTEVLAFFAQALAIRGAKEDSLYVTELREVPHLGPMGGLRRWGRLAAQALGRLRQKAT